MSSREPRDTGPTSTFDDSATETQRLSALGQLLAGISHESRNILTAILSFSQVGQRRQSDPAKMAEILKLIESETLRCIDLHTTVLSQVASGATSTLAATAGAGSSCRLADVLASVSRLIGHQMDMHRVRLETSAVDPEIEVSGPGPSLGQVFLNLLINAMQATPEFGRVTLTADRISDDQIQVNIEDSGPGVPEAMRKKIFEPMFTTKPSGTGLGLAVSHGIVESVGGSIELRDSELGGARFVVTLPCTVNQTEA